MLSKITLSVVQNYWWKNLNISNLFILGGTSFITHEELKKINTEVIMIQQFLSHTEK